MNYIKLHLVGYAWEYIYDARTYERQIYCFRSSETAKQCGGAS
jgi:hypothetical protein